MPSPGEETPPDSLVATRSAVWRAGYYMELGKMSEERVGSQSTTSVTKVSSGAPDTTQEHGKESIEEVEYDECCLGRAEPAGQAVSRVSYRPVRSGEKGKRKSDI